MRSFLDALWAVIYAANNDGAPPNTHGPKQIIVTLSGFQGFFGKGGTKIERFFRIDAYLRTGTVIEIGTDASPWASDTSSPAH